jgi:microcystin-dependent protein
MAGTISFSLSQQFDKYGEPLSGGKLYFFEAGTTTPQNAYKDSNLTLPWPNPIELDEAGRIPQFFLDDGSIKIRLADADGVTQIAADGVLVIGPSSGGGGGTPVDATTVLQTGDIKARYGTGAHSGWVRANGRTIGSSTSGASERANADCQALFEYLWGADANLTVSSGRGVSANADWTANKTIALPDWRGRVVAGLDDMGNSAAGRLTSAIFGTDPTVLGNAGGVQKIVLTKAQLPTDAPTGTITITDPGHNHNFSLPIYNNAAAGVFVADATSPQHNTYNSSTVIQNNTTGITAAFVGAPLGSGADTPNVQPSALATIYIKL